MESKLYAKHLEIVRHLRSPQGCPWDREQSPRTIRNHLIEEAYEVIEAIDEEDSDHLREELGDVLLLVSMITAMEEEKKTFTARDVLEEINAKLIRRHPHVFGDAQAADAQEVLVQWEKIKEDLEGRRGKDSLLDEIKRGMPPLERSCKLQKKAAKAGFDWPDRRGPLAKIQEELEELEEVSLEEDQQKRREEELGDLLFSVVNLARHLSIDPALALHRTNIKFEKRFRHVEKRMGEAGKLMTGDELETMEAYWQEAKSAPLAPSPALRSSVKG